MSSKPEPRTTVGGGRLGGRRHRSGRLSRHPAGVSADRRQHIDHLQVEQGVQHHARDQSSVARPLLWRRALPLDDDAVAKETTKAMAAYITAR